MNDELTPERITLNKEQGIRQLIHSAIRLIGEEESPIAVHLLIQSADRAIIDVAKHRGIELKLDWEDWIKPEYLAKFRKHHRGLANFLKHADRDADESINLTNLMARNLMDLYVVIANYTAVFQAKTNHMVFFQTFLLHIYPNFIILPEPLHSSLRQSVARCAGMTPREFFEMRHQYSSALPDFYKERMNDLGVYGDFYILTFSELRDGVTKSPRKFRIPAY